MASRQRLAWPAALVACAWILLLAPAAIFSRWFSLDIGGVFNWAASEDLLWILSPENLGGRYFPVYWCYNYLVFELVSTRLWAHFAAQAVLFAASLAMTCVLLFRLTRDARLVLAFGVLACLGGPVAENLYTIGKAEWLAFLFVMAIVSLMQGAEPARHVGWVGRMAVMAGLTTFAMWSKETSLVLVVLAPSALAIGFWLSRGLAERLPRAELNRYVASFVAVILGIAAARLPPLMFGPAGQRKHYVDYDIDAELVLENLGFYVTQQPDVLLFGIAALALFAVQLLRIRAPGGNASPAIPQVMLVGGLLAMGWGYYAGLLVWRWPMGYYMLLPSILFKFAALYGAHRALREGWLRPWWSWILGMGLVACVLYALVHSFYVVSSQVSYSRMYSEALARYAQASAPHERLVIESFPFYAEQVTNSRQVIEFSTGKRRSVGGIADVLNPAVSEGWMLKLLNVTRQQVEDNVGQLPRKGDFVLLMTGNKLATWFVRGVTPYYSDESMLLKDGMYDMELVAQNREFAPGAFVDVWHHRLHVGPTYVGYKLYRVTSDEPRIVWRGRYPDGWTGRSASMRLMPEYAKRLRLTLSTPDFNSPNLVTLRVDGRKRQTLRLVAGREHAVEIENDGSRQPLTVEIEVARAVVPKELKINKDKREIGVLVRLERLE